MMAWVDDLPLGLTRTIGALELLGVVGLVVPPLTGVAPWLALVAAVGLVALQVGATTLHLARREAGAIWLNVGLLVLGGLAAWLATVWL
ncbi:DoxX family protein [Isoptericola sp. NPDC057653]|uniref:DoxX family protein n=1 Tax=Isoptericola sp. NPDC057653 TaxID=3346195 RepID=UPI00369E62D9